MDKLDDLYQAAIEKTKTETQKRNQIRFDIETLTEQLDALPELLDQALVENNYEAYTDLTNRKGKMEFELASKKKQIHDKQYNRIEDFEDEWKAFITEYERDFGKLFKEYEKAKEALYPLFHELYEMQKKAASLRAAIANACGLHPMAGDYDHSDYAKVGKFSGLQKAVPFEIASAKNLPPDAYIFANMGKIPLDKFGEYERVIRYKSNN